MLRTVRGPVVPQNIGFVSTWPFFVQLERLQKNTFIIIKAEH